MTSEKERKASNDEQIEASLWLQKLSRAAPREQRVLFPLIESIIGSLDGELGIDLGCGDGWSTNLLAGGNLKKIIGIDTNSVLIEHAKGRFSTNRSVVFKQADASNLDFIVSKSASVVLSKAMLQHLNDDKAAKALAEISRVLLPGGKFCLVVVHPIWNILFTQVPEEDVTSRFASYIGSKKILLSDPSDPYCGERYRRSISWYSSILYDNRLAHQVLEVQNDGAASNERYNQPLFLVFHGHLS
jgi:ubiquinone/menaquinone biosynthesis C-methylase UbiE